MSVSVTFRANLADAAYQLRENRFAESLLNGVVRSLAHCDRAADSFCVHNGASFCHLPAGDTHVLEGTPHQSPFTVYHVASSQLRLQRSCLRWSGVLAHYINTALEESGYHEVLRIRFPAKSVRFSCIKPPLRFLFNLFTPTAVSQSTYRGAGT